MKPIKRTDVAFWFYLISVFRYVLGFFVSAYVAKKIGPNLLGSFESVFVIYTLVELLVQVINGNVLKKKFVINTHEEDRVFKTYFVFTTLVGSFFFFVINISFPHLFHLTSEEGFLLKLFSLSLFFTGFTGAFLWLESHLYAKSLFYMTVFSITTVSLLRIYVVTELGSPLVYLAWITFSQTIFMSLSAVFFSYKKLFSRFFKVKVDLLLLKDLIKESFLFYCCTLFSFLYVKFDNFWVRNYLNVESAGFYSVAVKLVEPWVFVSSGVVQSFFPGLMRDLSQKEKNLDSFVKLVNVTTLISFVLSICLFFGARFFVTFLFGKAYLSSVPLLQVYCVNVFFIFWMNVQYSWDLALGRSKQLIYRTFFAALINVVGNYFLTPKFGAMGAVCSTLLSYSFHSLWGHLGTLNFQLFKITVNSLKPSSLLSAFYLLKLKVQEKFFLKT